MYVALYMYCVHALIFVHRKRHQLYHRRSRLSEIDSGNLNTIALSKRNGTANYMGQQVKTLVPPPLLHLLAQILHVQLNALVVLDPALPP